MFYIKHCNNEFNSELQTEFITYRELAEWNIAKFAVKLNVLLVDIWFDIF